MANCEDFGNDGEGNVVYKKNDTKEITSSKQSESPERKNPLGVVGGVAMKRASIYSGHQQRK